MHLEKLTWELLASVALPWPRCFPFTPAGKTGKTGKTPTTNGSSAHLDGLSDTSSGCRSPAAGPP